MATWKAVMACTGVVTHRGQHAKWEALLAEHRDPYYDSGESKARAKALAEESASIGGALNRADVGTSLHTLTALADLGKKLNYQSQKTLSVLTAYVDGLNRYGVRIVEDAVELTVVLDDYQVAGTFDRLARAPWPGFDLPLVADLKTGSNLSYSWNSIAVQLAAYAHADAIYVQGEAEDGSEDQRLPMPDVDQDHGLVLWLDADAEVPNLEIWFVDLRAGWEAFEHSMWTRKWRTTDVAFSADLMSPSLASTSPDALTELLEASIPVRKPQKQDGAPEIRFWLQGRIDDIGKHSDDAKTMLAQEWPNGVPTLRKSEVHSADELAQIEQLCDLVEGRFWMPFPDSRPVPTNQQQTNKGATKP